MKRDRARVLLWRLGAGSLLAAAALLALGTVFDGFLGERTADTAIPALVATLAAAGLLLLIVARRCRPPDPELAPRHVPGGRARLAHLTPAETLLVRRCLLAAVHGPFFPDAEFQTLFGMSRQQVAAVADAWPPDERREDVRLAIHNTLHNLLGCPHGRSDAWSAHLLATVEDVQSVFAKWLGMPGSRLA